MAMVINTNVDSIFAQRQLGKTNNALATSMQRLSSGLRVNSAKDDAAGLAIADRMTSQIRGMTVAVRNANDGISMAQTAEAAMGQMTEMLQRMRDLAVQSANDGALSSNDKLKLQDEYLELTAELQRTVDNTSFNGKEILGGCLSGALFQVGFSTAAHNQISITVSDMNTMNGLQSVLAGTFAISGSNAEVGSAILGIDAAIASIDGARSKLGAMQNRFTYTISNLQSSIENNSAARSRIMDTDFAMETSSLSRNQILQQAGTAMLAQANQSQQNVLSLLR